MRISIRGIAHLGAALVILLGHYSGICRAAEPPSIDEVIAGLVQRENAFFSSESMKIRYERVKSEDIVPTNASGGFLPAEWTLAYRGTHWFVRRRFTKPVSTDEFVVPAEPETQVIKNGVIVECRQDSETAIVDHFELGRNFYGGLYYTRNIALNAPKFIAAPRGADFEEMRKQYPDAIDHPFLPDVLQNNRERYRVLPESIELEGGRCWVVEWPGMDRFMVDPERGFAVVHRLYHWGPGQPLKYEITNSDHREVKAGLWLPFRQTENRYASIIAEEKSLWGKVASRSEFVLHSVEFDNVPESLFDIELPPGTRVIDIVRDMKYTVPGRGSGDPFEPEVNAGREILNASGRGWWLLYLNIGIVLVLVVFLAVRMWLRRGGAGK